MLDSARLQQFWSTTPIALLIVGPERRIQQANPAADDLLGDSAAPIVGQDLDDVLEDARALLDGDLGSQPKEIEVHRPRGDAVQVLTVTAWALPGGGGAALAIVDVSVQAGRAEQQAQVRKMRALATMAGNLSHHFNNILGSAVTRIDFARQSNDIRVLRRCLDTTAAALQRATHLLDGLLAFAEADYRDSNLADLTETLIDFTEALAPRAQAANVVLDVRLAAVPVLAVPRARFVTLLNSLVDNALEAMTDGGQLSIELIGRDDRVVCRVTDDGPGISDGELERVFEPFYSTKSTITSTASTHAGLGLSVAIGIAHELGGDIHLHSRPDGGTRVEIHLPIDPRVPLHEPVRVAE